MYMLSMDLSKFLIKVLYLPHQFLGDGSLWDYIMSMGHPIKMSKVSVSKACSANGTKLIHLLNSEVEVNFC